MLLATLPDACDWRREWFFNCHSAHSYCSNLPKQWATVVCGQVIQRQRFGWCPGQSCFPKSHHHRATGQLFTFLVTTRPVMLFMLKHEPPPHTLSSQISPQLKYPTSRRNRPGKASWSRQPRCSNLRQRRRLALTDPNCEEANLRGNPMSVGFLLPYLHSS